MAGIYDIIMGSEPEAQASAGALARAIRGNRGGQNLYALGAENVPAALSAVHGQNALQDTRMLEGAAIARGNMLSRAMQAQADRDLKVSEGALNRNAMLQAAGIKAAGRSTMGPQVSDTTLNVWAENYRKTGKMPELPRGMAVLETRDAIVQRAVEQDPAFDPAVAAAGYTSDKAALGKLQTQREMIGAFEETARRNIGILKEYVAKIPDTGIPVLNRPVRALAKSLGSTTMAGYDIALRTVQREASRILETANAQGIITNDARKALEHDISSASSPEQMIEVLGVLDRDFTNRMEATDKGISDIKGRIGGGKSEAAAPKPPATDLKKKYRIE